MGTPEGTLHKMYNSIVERLNKNNALLNVILMVPDRDVILQADFFQPGIFYVMHQQLRWLARNINRALEGHYDYLK